MDATVATGAAAMMAIRVLLDYDVPEENIQLVSLLMAEIGVHSIAYAFPKVGFFCLSQIGHPKFNTQCSLNYFSAGSNCDNRTRSRNQ